MTIAAVLNSIGIKAGRTSSGTKAQISGLKREGSRKKGGRISVHCHMQFDSLALLMLERLANENT
jgi:hypothetical protein